MARTVKPRRHFPKRNPLTFVGNQLFITRRAEMLKRSYKVPALADRPPNYVFKFPDEIPYKNHDLMGQSAGMSLTPSQSSKEGTLPPAPNKPYTRSSSKISSQDALEDKLARISLTPSQSSNKGILPPAPNKPCMRSSSKIPLMGLPGCLLRPPKALRRVLCHQHLISHTRGAVPKSHLRMPSRTS